MEKISYLKISGDKENFSASTLSNEFIIDLNGGTPDNPSDWWWEDYKVVNGLYYATEDWDIIYTSGGPEYYYRFRINQ